MNTAPLNPFTQIYGPFQLSAILSPDPSKPGETGIDIEINKNYPFLSLDLPMGFLIATCIMLPALAHRGTKMMMTSSGYSDALPFFEKTAHRVAQAVSAIAITSILIVGIAGILIIGIIYLYKKNILLLQKIGAEFQRVLGNDTTRINRHTVVKYFKQRASNTTDLPEKLQCRIYSLFYSSKFSTNDLRAENIVTFYPIASNTDTFVKIRQKSYSFKDLNPLTDEEITKLL